MLVALRLLEDFLVVVYFKFKPEYCISSLKDTFQRLQVLLSDGKRIHWVFGLSIHLDSNLMQVSPPLEKLVEICEAMDHVFNAVSISK